MIQIPIVKMVMVGPVMLYIWGFFVALGIITAYLLAKKRFHHIQKATGHLESLFIYAVIGAFVGARLLWVLIEYKIYFAHPIQILRIWEGGFAFTGGFILSFLVILVYSNQKKLSLLQITDALAFPLAVGMFIGRFGCLFTGLHPGVPTTFGGVYDMGDGVYLAAWPFWAILNWFVASVFLFLIEKRTKATGLLTVVAVVWWGLWRFFGDFIRVDDSFFGGDPRYLLLTPTQYLAFFVLIFIVVIFIKRAFFKK